MKGLRLSVEKIVLIFLGVWLSLFNYAQDLPLIKCGIEKEMNKFYEERPEAREEIMALEEFTRNFIKNRKKLKNIQAENYIIPVVFHVFGTDFAGKTVTDQKIQTALEKLNEDFNGLNDDFNTVDANFEGVKSTLNIEFKLAQIDPDGNPTTGITYNPELSGFGNGSGYNTSIRLYAWDNYRYMNVFIMLDLYNDGDYYNSGVAWYPNTWMSDNKLARVVYNGRYLYDNLTLDKLEFASVLTHEFGHWLNLIHTFEGYCTEPNDHVDDTPACDYAAMGCTNVYNCKAEEINGENYMDYNVTCYKMYTAGQVDRMVAALDHPSRQPLWQDENLVATGLLADNINPSIPANLFALNVASDFITLTWNKSTDNYSIRNYEVYVNETLAGTVQDTLFKVVSLDPETSYTLKVRAKDIGDNYSDFTENIVVSTLQASGDVYCSALSEGGNEYISRVEMGTINNSSGKQSYSDFTALETELNKEKIYELKVRLDEVNINGNSVAGWVDWNQDGDFDDSSEKYILDITNDTLATINITVPTLATLGNTRLRIRLYYYQANDVPCGSSIYGEVEDYSLKISGVNASPLVIQNANSNFIVYPNPAKNKVFIKVDSKRSDEMKVNIFNYQGQLVYHNQFKNIYRESEIPLNINLSPGVYSIELCQGEEKMVRKLVIMD